MNNQITIVEFDGWQGLYINGKLADTNRRVTAEDAFDRLKIPYKRIFSTERDYSEEDLPESLKDVIPDQD